MLRVYRPLRSLFGSPRISSRLRGSQTIRVERVKVRKGRTATRFLGTVIKGALVFQLLLWTISPVSEEEETSSKPDADADVDADADADADARFIPFPLTTRTLPREPYRAGSPEWQEFVRVSRDRAAQQEILQLAAKAVLDAASKSPSLIQKTGSDFKLRRWWMDIFYPYYAPIEYERSGLLVTDDALMWVTMPCDPALARHLERVLWPKPLAMGIFAMSTEAFKQAGREVARYFGYGSGEPSNTQARPNPGSPPISTRPGPEMQKALERIRQEATRRPEEVNDPGSVASSAGASRAAPSSPRHSGGPLSEPDGKKHSTTDPGSRAQDVSLSLANTQLWKRFKEAYTRNRPVKMVSPPRGSISVTGLVELETSRAYLVVETMTWYNPKTKAIVPESSHMFIRKLHQKRIVALRP